MGKGIAALVTVVLLATPVFAQEKPGLGALGEDAPVATPVATRAKAFFGNALDRTKEFFVDLGASLTAPPAPRDPTLVLAVRTYRYGEKGSDGRTEIHKRDGKYILVDMESQDGCGCNAGPVKSERILTAEEAAALEADLARYKASRDKLVHDGAPMKGWTHVGVEVPGAGYEFEGNFKIEKGGVVWHEPANTDALTALLTDKHLTPNPSWPSSTKGVSSALDKIK